MLHDLQGEVGMSSINEVKSLLSECMWGSDERITREFEQYLVDGNRVLYGSSLDGKLVGIIGLIQYSNCEFELKHIAVKASNRKQGLGRGMIIECMQQLEINKLVAETDHEAVDFYRKLGFEIIRLGEKYPGVERYKCILKLD